MFMTERREWFGLEFLMALTRLSSLLFFSRVKICVILSGNLKRTEELLNF